MNTPSKVEEILRAMVELGQLFGSVFAAEQGLEFAGNQRELGEQLLGLIAG